MTCNRSDCIHKIYAAEHEYLAARKLGMTAISTNPDDVCIYVDKDILTRYSRMAMSNFDQVTLPDEIPDLVQLMDTQLTTLTGMQPTFLPGTDLDAYDDLSKNVQKTLQKIKTKFESDTANNANNIKNLERNITALRKNNENLAEEMELELQTVTAQYDKRISDLQRQINAESKVEPDNKIVMEMQQKLNTLTKEIENARKSNPNNGNITPNDILQLLRSDTQDASDVIAVMTAKEASSLIPRWNNTENIVSFCKKVQSAYAFCKDEGYSEEKFCQILRLHLPDPAAQVFDQLSEANKKSVTEITSALLAQLDRQENEYLQQFSKLKKEPLESHNAYALRVQRLYQLGTGSETTMTARDKKVIVEAFLNGLPLNEQSALRLVATDSEMSDIQTLAKRASRSAITQNNVNAMPGTSPAPAAATMKLPDRQSFQGNKKRFNCYYCTKTGHSWRRCYLRARQNPEWKPQLEGKSRDATKPKQA